jgi:hypothetical protein
MIQKGGGPAIGVLSTMTQKGGGPVLGVLSKITRFFRCVACCVIIVAQAITQTGRRHLLAAHINIGPIRMGQKLVQTQMQIRCLTHQTCTKLRIRRLTYPQLKHDEYIEQIDPKADERMNLIGRCTPQI